MLGALVTMALSACPLGGELGALPSPPASIRPAPVDLAAQLASQRAVVVPSSLIGPLDLGDLGAVVAAVRCGGTPERRRAPCDLVVAHLAPIMNRAPGVGERMELSGVVQAFPLPARAAREEVSVLGVALRDLAGDPTPELVVRWRVGATTSLGALGWLGFGRVFGPEPVVDPTCPGAMALACDAGVPTITRTCPDGTTTWRFDAARATFRRRSGDDGGSQ